jgi:apolipoprotein N-acyltransferase
VYGISFLFALTAAVMALAVLRRPRAELAWLVLVPLVALLPRIPEAGNGTASALLAQPNISESEDWSPGTLDRTVRRQVTASLQAALAQPERPPELIVWPEVPAPFYYDRDEQFREYLNGLARMTRAHVLVGVVAHTADGAPLNSAQLISPQGRPVSRYDKVNLVPFGEFVPWPFGFAQNISSEVGDFRPGRQVVVSPLGEQRISTFICYESVFPNFVRRFVDRGAGVLVNISNDGWFGKTSARVQHLSIVRMRPVENRRWILRSTNNGLTTTIDAAGRVRDMLPPYQEGISSAAFNYLTEKTLYTRWGDWFPLVCATIALLCLVADRVA